MRQRMSVLSMILVLCLSEGCTRFQKFRPLPPQNQAPICRESSQQSCDSAPVIETPDAPNHLGYLLGFVELDDLGWFWDRQQKQAVVEAVRNVAEKQDVIIVVFAHGWNHDSSAADGNVLKFQQVLERLSRIESESARSRCQPERRIVGVYLGWRGKAFKRAGNFPATLYNWTSFFSRKATAHRVGSEDAAELLSDLESIRTKANGSAGNPPRSSRMVVVGHSFGTAVVYGAVSRILAERRLHLEDGDIKAASFGDLVVLVNPAIEASLLFPFEQATRSYTRSDDRMESEFHPVLAVFASQGDGPNRVLFPIGRTLTTLFKRHRRENPPGFPTPPHFQGKAVRRAAGQFQPTISLLLCPANEKRDGQSFRCTRNYAVSEGADENEPGKKKEIDWKAAPPTQLSSLTRSQPLAGPFQKGERDDLPLSTSTLFRLRSGPMTPYPIISVDNRLIRDHNDIFTDFFAPFLIDFVSVWVQPRPSVCGSGQKTGVSGSKGGAEP